MNLEDNDSHGKFKENAVSGLTPKNGLERWVGLDKSWGWRRAE